MVPFVHVRVMEFIAFGFELVPLNAGMEDIENVVKDFVERELGFWPFFGSFQMGVNLPVKVFATDLSRDVLVDERSGRGLELGIHRHLLSDEGGQFEAPYFPCYSLILPYLCQNLTMSSIDDFEVGYAPSFAVLQHCRTRPALRGNVLTAVADPDGSLFYSREEIRIIERYFQDKTVLEGNQATFGELQSKFGRADVLHLACHGRADLARPLESGLSLADGVLSLEKIFQRVYIRSGSFVILSACETGVSQVSSTDEYFGLGAGFLFAGARCVLSSLWPVDDFSTCVFFSKFYHNFFTERISIGASLRDAQNFLRTSGQDTLISYCEDNQIRVPMMNQESEFPLSHPVLWAPFQAIGTFWDVLQ